jgi:peptidoglycan/xylan/chitin deacetylase (PgdA/CDA1 family)
MSVLVRAYRLLGTAGTLAGLHEPEFARRDAVLMYHSVRPAGEVREGTSDVTREAFRRHLAYYTDRFEVVDLPRVVPGVDPDPTRKRVALTFDDGYRDFYTEVRPLLHEFGVPATVFVVPGFVGGRRRREQAMNTGHLFDVLTAEQLGDLADDDLVTVGNHTLTHHHLGKHHDRDLIESEVLDARDELESRFGLDVDRFSYPNGGHNATSVEVVRGSHGLAVLDESRRPVRAADDPVLLPRIDAGLPFEQVKWQLSDANAALVDAADRVLDLQ